MQIGDMKDFLHLLVKHPIGLYYMMFFLLFKFDLVLCFGGANNNKEVTVPRDNCRNTSATYLTNASPTNSLLLAGYMRQ
jgi:hypothetical protein